jgi:ATP-dependent protease ClpP protease subunit
MDYTFFSNLNDNDFYSDKLNHIYLDGEIDSKKINKLIDDIKKTNNEKKLKPILIHINSTGGNLEDGMRLMSIYKLSKVPIATIIDSYSFSIATLLSINSPYRVMTKYSFCLLHEYRLSGYINSEKKDIVNIIKKFDNYFKTITAMYLNKTTFTKNELYKLLKHNLILDYKVCLKKKIVDRVIQFDNKIDKKEKININKLISNNHVNNLYISCNLLNEEIDKNIKEIDINKPCLIYNAYTECNDKKHNDDEADDDKEKNKINKPKKKKEYNILDCFNLISRIRSIKPKKYAIIDIPISLENLIPLLYTDRIYMYSHTFIICNLINAFTNYSILLDDNIKNSKLIIDKIKNILKEKTKMNVNDIDKKYIILNAKKAKELGICDEIIYA